MTSFIRFGQGVFSDAEISPERRLYLAETDNQQLKDTLTAIADTAHGVPGAELIKVMALLALAKSIQP